MAVGRGRREDDGNDSAGVFDLWRRLNRRTKALLVTLVAFLGGFQVIRDQLVTPLWQLYSHRQPGFDARLLSTLQPGIRFGEFEDRLKHQSTAILRHKVMVLGPDNRPVRTRDELFVLETAYVEAFVSDSQSVVGYTITIRVPQAAVRIGPYPIEFGKTMIADAPLRSVEAVAGACGTHIEAYYEVSDNSNANNAQRFAVGNTDAGFEKKRLDRPLCPDLGLPEFSPPSTAFIPSSEGLYVADIYEAGDEFLKRNSAQRYETLVNSASITAPGYEIAPEMLSLHPDLVRQYANAD